MPPVLKTPTGGNITTITDPITGNQTFGYDALNRLTSATGAYTHSYSYDQIGNMLSNTLVGSYTYPLSGTSSVRVLKGTFRFSSCSASRKIEHKVLHCHIGTSFQIHASS
jgi:YD repeat-containing protein